MTRLTFADGKDRSVVKLYGRVVGTIVHLSYGKGWVYSPKGSSLKGEPMPTLEAVKRSLRGQQ